MSIISIFLGLGSYILFLFFQFRIAKKVQHPKPWFAFVPILNVIQFIQIAKCSLWWLIPLFIPFINIITIIWVCMKFAFNLGEKKSFGVLLILPPVNIWAMWKLGSKDAILTSDDLESIRQIKQAINNNFPKDSLKIKVTEAGISPQKADWLIDRALSPIQTKTWVIVLLAILEIPLFLLETLLITFLFASSLLFSVFPMLAPSHQLSSEINVNSTNLGTTEVTNEQQNNLTDNDKNHINELTNISKTEKIDTPVYDKVFDLETVKIELDTTPQKIIDSDFGDPEIEDVKWKFNYKIENKTDSQIKIKTSVSGNQSNSLSEEYINASKTKELSIDTSIISGARILNGLLSWDFYISKCQGNCINDPQSIIESKKQFVFISGFDTPKIVSEEEGKQLENYQKEKDKKAKENPLFYKLSLLPDNKFLPIEKLVPSSGQLATRSLGILIENNDNFPTSDLSGNIIDCEVSPDNGKPYALSDTFWENFSSNHSFLIKEFPSPLSEESGTITCNVKAQCPVSKSTDDKSRKCPDKDASGTYKIDIYAPSFKYEVSKTGEISIIDNNQNIKTEKNSKNAKKRRPVRRHLDTDNIQKEIINH